MEQNHFIAFQDNIEYPVLIAIRPYFEFPQLAFYLSEFNSNGVGPI
jgi:hypothetical protein